MFQLLNRIINIQWNGPGPLEQPPGHHVEYPDKELAK